MKLIWKLSAGLALGLLPCIYAPPASADVSGLTAAILQNPLTPGTTDTLDSIQVSFNSAAPAGGATATTFEVLATLDGEPVSLECEETTPTDPETPVVTRTFECSLPLAGVEPGAHLFAVTVNELNSVSPGPVDTASAELAFEITTAIDLSGLKTLVEELAAAGLIAPELVRPLLASVNAAEKSFARGNRRAGCNQLKAFRKKVLAASKQVGKRVPRIDPAAAAELLAAVAEVCPELGPAPGTGNGGGNGRGGNGRGNGGERGRGR